MLILTSGQNVLFVTQFIIYTTFPGKLYLNMNSTLKLYILFLSGSKLPSSLLRHSSSVLQSSRYPQPPVLLASKNNPSSVQNVTLSPKQEKFYSKYDSTEGVTTAVVLGGFFVFVCLLVVYKTKLKPAWKDRQARRHDNTPATRSELSSHSHLHKEHNLSCSWYSEFKTREAMEVFLKGLVWKLGNKMATGR